MNSTHRIVIATAVALLLACAPAGASWLASGGPGAGDRLTDQDQTEKFSKTVPLPKGGSVDVANISGDIVVTGGAGDQVVLEAVKRGRTAEDLKALEIEVVTSATRVEIRARYPRERRNINASVDFTVTVPRGASVVVHSVSGNLKLGTIDGAVRAESVSGNVVVTSAAQLETAKSVSGDVTIDASGNDADLTIGAVSGNVKAKATKARGLDANSVSGDVTLADVTCSRLKVNSISGDVAFAGPLAKGGRYIIASHSGDVTLYADGKAGFEVHAGSFSGDITSDLKIVATFGGEGERGGHPGPKPKSGGPGERLEGTYGDGGALLELGTFSGDVKIVSKTAGTPVKK